MVMVDIDKEVYEAIKKIIEKDKVTYPSLKNFVDKAVREKIQIEVIK